MLFEIIYGACQEKAIEPPFLASLLVAYSLQRKTTCQCHRLKVLAVSSPINYDSRFIAIKDSAETTHLNFSSRAAEDYNSPFSMVEFIASLKLSGNTSPVPDRIHNIMFRHLPTTGREFLLSMYNRIWVESSVLFTWKNQWLRQFRNQRKIASLLAAIGRSASLVVCARPSLPLCPESLITW
jgi:hypothetical protein